MIHISQLNKEVDRPERFSFKFVSESGELIHIKAAVLTSWHSSGKTMNVKLFPSEEIRTIRRITIVEWNGKEVCV